VPLFVLALLIGVVGGLRAMTPLMAVSWAAHLGWLHLENTPLAFMGYAYSPYIFTLFAIGELINDKLPKTPSRKLPVPFAVRILVGAFGGAALGYPAGEMILGAVAGAIGGVAGTLGGYEFRRRLAQSVGNDLPVALLEDAIAVGLAFWIVSR
jgi:uncharacterized membrane protein